MLPKYTAVQTARSSKHRICSAYRVIFRTVALYSTPKVQVRDLVVIPDLDETYTNGSLAISADIRNFGKKAAKGYQMAYTLYANKLYSDENTPVANAVASATVNLVNPNETVEAEKAIM